MSGDAGHRDGQGLTPPLAHPAEALGAISRAASRSETIKGDGPRELGKHKTPPGPSKTPLKVLKSGPQAKNFGVPFILGRSRQAKHGKPKKFRAKTALQEIQLLQMANK